jgi:MFS family permease
MNQQPTTEQAVRTNAMWFLTGHFLAFFSFGMWSTAVSWIIVSRGESGDLALYSTTLSVAAMLGVPLLAPLGDRLSRKGLLLIGMLILVVCAVGRVFLINENTFRLLPILLIDLVACIAFGLIQPIVGAMLAELVKAGALAGLMGKQKALEAGARIAAPLLCGAILASVGQIPALWGVVLASFLAVLAFSRIQIAPTLPTTGHNMRSWANDVLQGFRVKWRIPVERHWTGLMLMFNMLTIPLIGLLLPLKIQSLHLGADWFGVIQASLFAGSLLGYLAFSHWYNKKWGMLPAMVLAAAGIGVGSIAIGLIELPVLLALVYFMIGLWVAVYQLNGQSQRTLAVPGPYRVRLAAINIMISQLGAGGGMALAGVLGKNTGVDWILFLYGGFAFFLAGITHYFGRRSALMHLTGEEADGYYLRAYPKIFEVVEPDKGQAAQQKLRT